MKKILLGTFFLLLYNSFLYSIEGDILPLATEFAKQLGSTIEDIQKTYGNPSHMFVARAQNARDDNIVFYYPDNIYFFWFQDRVWQIRSDERWEGEIDGVSMGMSRKEILDLWGEPINTTDENPTWTLPDRGYPSRIQLYFQDDKLIDIYVYRSDW